jgi:hypothetical protein
MNSSEFDRRFEDGESVIDALDLEASRLGMTRQSIIKVWLAERLERRRDPAESAVAEPTSF